MSTTSKGRTLADDFREAATLADGTRVELRFIRPADAPELRRAFEELSTSTKLQRFGWLPRALDGELLRYLTEVDGRDHCAIVAVVEDHDLRGERGVGVARFVRHPVDRDAAEAAIVVTDAYQGRGLGRAMLALLTEAARDRGVLRFRADVLEGNAAMRGLLASAGARELRADAGVVAFEVELGAGAAAGDTRLRRLLRAAAGLVTGGLAKLPRA